MPAGQRRRRVFKLWSLNPHCLRCGVKTILAKELIEKYKCEGSELARHANRIEYGMLATLDHVFSRYHLKDRLINPTAEVRTRLLCYKCNNDLARDENTSVPLEVRQKMTATGHGRYNKNLKRGGSSTDRARTL